MAIAEKDVSTLSYSQCMPTHSKKIKLFLMVISRIWMYIRGIEDKHFQAEIQGYHVRQKEMQSMAIIDSYDGIEMTHISNSFHAKTWIRTRTTMDTDTEPYAFDKNKEDENQDDRDYAAQYETMDTFTKLYALDEKKDGENKAYKGYVAQYETLHTDDELYDFADESKQRTQRGDKQRDLEQRGEAILIPPAANRRGQHGQDLHADDSGVCGKRHMYSWRTHGKPLMHLVSHPFVCLALHL